MNSLDPTQLGNIVSGVVRDKEPEVFKLTDKTLYLPTTPFDFRNPPVDPVWLSNSLAITTHELGGAGLSANQVGFDFSVMYIRGITSALFNPRIVMFSDETELGDEGCLSYPGLVMKIRRNKIIRIRSTDVRGKVDTQMYGGLTARIIQHEMMHLLGKTFFAGASRTKLNLAVEKCKKKYDKDYSYLLKYIN